MVLDVHLPDIDGFELCRILRSRPSTARLPVLHLSAAYITDEDKVRGLDSGADGYLTHPVDPSVLVASVHALVRARVAEEAMRRSEAQFRAIYARAPSGICLLDPAGHFIDANPAMLTLLDRPLSEVVGKSLLDFVSTESAQRASAFIHATHAGESRDEFPVINGKQSVVYLRLSLLPAIQPQVNMLLATDVTERTKLERQRQDALQREREARNEAERLSRMKDEFIAVLSHELRSPLTAIRGWVHILSKRSNDAETRERGIEAIGRNVDLQARLVSDLLDMSSITLGKMRLSVEDVQPIDVVQATVAALAPKIEERAIALRIDASAVPSIKADLARLHQIVTNLLSNAIKFSDPGGEIVVSIRSDGDGVLLSFADKGKGIAPDFLPFLFDRFTQADAGSNRRQGGLGLGLSIVRHLVESHGGKVTVDSAGAGQGATFSVWLPTAGPAQATKMSSDAHDGPTTDPESILADTNLLVVEDDADVCAMLQIVLGDRGAHVQIAHDYDGALQALQGAQFDLMVSDIGMPGQDGYALVREVRRREGGGRRLPAIALTSYTRDQDRENAVAAGFDVLCAKPVNPVQLVHEIRRLLARS
jgi:PAS domain S-box-containing protein